MGTELRPLPGVDLRNERLQELGSSMEGLNARIARLAIGLGVSLQDEHELARVMSRPPLVAAPVERRQAGERRPPDPMVRSAERRTAHHWEELRGLLVLRYHTEIRYVDEVGVTATQQILIQVEEHLERDGFSPGADGLHLKQLFAPT